MTPFIEIFICTGLLVYWFPRMMILLRRDEDEIEMMMDQDCWMVRWFLAVCRSLFKGTHTS